MEIGKDRIAVNRHVHRLLTSLHETGYALLPFSLAVHIVLAPRRSKVVDKRLVIVQVLMNADGMAGISVRGMSEHHLFRCPDAIRVKCGNV